MRAVFLVTVLIILPFSVIHFMKMLTGEPMSAIFLGLTLFIWVAALFSRPPASSGRRASRG